MTRVLVVNAGSSSIKTTLLDHDDTVLAHDSLPVEHGGFDADALAAALDRAPAPDAVGHRVVHGGSEFTEPVRLDDRVRDRLRDLADLAPLHQAKSLAGIDAVGRALPDVPAVACFDTAFHATLPPAAATYALPAAWRDRYALRRYGFHGLSHAYASRTAAELTGRSRTVVAHLGAGASLCAVRDGRSVDTTMGFTPLEGLVMATRSGSVDPGLLLWLIEHEGLAPADVADALEHDSGLTGLAGTGDLRDLLARDDDASRLAVDVYLHRLRAGIAAMAASLDGLDVLVFTGGVGEHSPQIRSRATDGLEFLGVALDLDRNAVETVTGAVDVGTSGAPVRTIVVESREDLEVAAGVRAVLTG
ncbi:acetate/propionate family kinase [Actinomadura atramentaria]|uniref:acetate/propionate family kinase n=1 Tax=Actinomadura atramentaria TaxID=1990 RepID=UPI00035D93E3|nr:acetate/propionate family kinase [Actinomadura atramentaria]